MPTYRPTLLEALASSPSFRSRTEDLAVEALGHILSTSEAARAVLSDLLAAAGVRVGPILRVATQATGSEGARPDLAGFDERGVERVLIEAKFAAALTPNQPVGYLDRLARSADGSPAALLFVSPAVRVESLWAELRRRAAASGVALESFRKGGVVRSAVVPAGPGLLLASWQVLLDRIGDGVAADSRVVADVQQLRGLVHRGDKDDFHPLSTEELRDQVSPLLVSLLEQLVDVAVLRAERRRVATRPKKKAQSWGYGHFLRLARVDVWFGIHFDRWVRSPTALLWLWFPQKSLVARPSARRALEPLRKSRPQQVFDADAGGLLVSVPLPGQAGSEALAVAAEACRDSAASGLPMSDAVVRKHELEPIVDAMVARLNELRQVLGASPGGSRAARKVVPAPRVGRVPAVAAAGMRKHFPRRVGELRRLVDDATDRGRGEGWADARGFRATVRRSGYGRYFRLGHRAGAQVWLGIDFAAWVRQAPATPLWLWFTPNSLDRRPQTRGALELLRAKRPSDLVEDGAGGLLVPVLVPVDQKYDAVLEAVVDRLGEVARLLDGS